MGAVERELPVAARRDQSGVDQTVPVVIERRPRDIEFGLGRSS
jgi:hypothetical protein